jgi:hypothetical protein
MDRMRACSRALLGRLSVTMVALTAAMTAGCGDDSADPDASTIDAQAQVGTITATWTLTSAGGEISCADVGASTVRVTALPIAGGFAAVDALACTGGSGTTRLLDIGTYNVTLELLGAGAVVLGSATFGDVEVTAGNDTDVGPAAFEVVASGNLAFTVSPGASGCDGSGITSVRFALRRAGSCVDTSFDVGGTGYDSDCATPFPGCIEADAAITATAQPSGPRELSVEGLVGDLVCYSAVVSFTIPGNDGTANLGEVVLTPQLDNAGGPGSDAGLEPDASVDEPDAGIDGGA